MGFGRRVSFKGISQEVLNGFPIEPNRVFWFDNVNLDDYVFNTKLLQYDDISSPEFIDGLSNFIELFWFSGSFNGFYVSYDSARWRVVTIENNDLIARTIVDKTFEIENNVIIKYGVNAKRPLIFNNEHGNPQHLVIYTKVNNSYDCYVTNDWVNFNRFNLKQLEDIWVNFKLSTSSHITLYDYLMMDGKIVDIYDLV
jgi:hypothetical protein